MNESEEPSGLLEKLYGEWVNSEFTIEIVDRIRVVLEFCQLKSTQILNYESSKQENTSFPSN